MEIPLPELTNNKAKKVKYTHLQINWGKLASETTYLTPTVKCTLFHLLVFH